jgi:hypothetical protein
MDPGHKAPPHNLEAAGAQHSLRARDMATMFEELSRTGFQSITDWTMRGDKIVLRSIAWKDHGGWLYAFVVDEDVKYVGLTNRVLRSRMSDYAHLGNSQTARLRRLIAAELAAGRVVAIYGRKEAEKERLVAEEDRLRLTYRPPWNRI